MRCRDGRGGGGVGGWVCVVEGVRRDMMYMGGLGQAGTTRWAGLGQAGQAGTGLGGRGRQSRADRRAAIGWARGPVLRKYREGWAWEAAL
jgi:hypothetical protein